MEGEEEAIESKLRVGQCGDGAQPGRACARTWTLPCTVWHVVRISETLGASVSAALGRSGPSPKMA